MRAIWTIGQEREKAHASQYVRTQSQRDLLFPIIDIVHDLNEGGATIQQFATAATRALENGGKSVWNSVDKWIADVANVNPKALEIWDSLAVNNRAVVRRQIAGRLYWYIPDPQSDRIFSFMRFDKSVAVRELAIDRYENRPGPDRNIVFKMFDANDPSSPGFNRGI